jgi:hypothetical protein
MSSSTRNRVSRAGEESAAMMRKRLFATLMAIAVSWLSVASMSAGQPPEVILFEGTTGRPFEAPGVYPRIYSGRVEFQHGKHFTDHGPTCGDCHHADSFDPGVGSESDVEVTRCVDCHDAPGLVYGRRVDETDAGDLVVHRANVFHTLCVGCHEESAAKSRAIVAPIACRGCHSQRQADYTLTGSEGS